jgi:hypothetical protein
VLDLPLLLSHTTCVRLLKLVDLLVQALLHVLCHALLLLLLVIISTLLQLRYLDILILQDVVELLHYALTLLGLLLVRGVEVSQSYVLLCQRLQELILLALLLRHRDCHLMDTILEFMVEVVHKSYLFLLSITLHFE